GADGEISGGVSDVAAVRVERDVAGEYTGHAAEQYVGLGLTRNEVDMVAAPLAERGVCAWRHGRNGLGTRRKCRHREREHRERCDDAMACTSARTNPH